MFVVCSFPLDFELAKWTCARTRAHTACTRSSGKGCYATSIVKVSTMVNTEEELEILRHLLAQNWKVPICVIGMGPLGTHTRVSFPTLARLSCSASRLISPNASGSPKPASASLPSTSGSSPALSACNRLRQYQGNSPPVCKSASSRCPDRSSFGDGFAVPARPNAAELLLAVLPHNTDHQRRLWNQCPHSGPITTYTNQLTAVQKAFARNQASPASTFLHRVG